MKKSSEIKIQMLILALVGAMVVAISSSVEADRTAPRKVEPVIYKNVRYVATPDAKMGYVEAWDLQSKKKLWELRIYAVKYDEYLEPDVQDVFITSLTIKDDRLVVTNERNQRYEVDLSNRKIFKIR